MAKPMLRCNQISNFRVSNNERNDGVSKQDAANVTDYIPSVQLYISRDIKPPS